MKYIIEIGNGNPKILEQKEDGTFAVIGLGAGENNLDPVKELVRLANAGTETNA